jgi:hypothetical protein
MGLGWLDDFYGVPAMATQIVMDHTGDTRHYFDAKDARELAKAEERFKQLTGSRIYRSRPHRPPAKSP